MGLFSCRMATSTVETVVSGLGTVVEAILSIPQTSELLPSCLQDSTSSSSRALSRAIGDVTTLDPATLDGVRAEGYVRLQKDIAESLMGNVIVALQTGLDGLSSAPAYDTEVELGDITITEAQAAILGVPQMFDGGKVILSALTTDDDQIDMKWHFAGTTAAFRLPDSTQSGAGAYDWYVHIVMTSVNTSSDLNARIALYGLQTLSESAEDGNGNSYPSGTVFTMTARGVYDGASNSQTVIFDPVTNTSSVDSQSAGSWRSLSVDSGTTSYLAVDQDGFNVAWADSTGGGVLAKGIWTDDSESLTQYRSEIYDDEGGLIKETLATSGLGTQLDFLADLDDGTSTDAKFLNLNDYMGVIAAAPSTDFQIKEWDSWDSTTQAHSISKMDYSADGGATWTTIYDGTSGNLALVPWLVIYRTGSDTGTGAWQSGDQIYFTVDSDGSNYDSEGYTIYSYELNMTYPSAATYMSGDDATYYQFNSFPLKALRLTDTLSDTGYVIQAEETGEETKTAQDGSTYTVPVYQYWLQKPATGDTALRTSPLTFSPDLGDLEISNTLHMKEYWFWDPDTETRSNVQAYVVGSSQGQPPLFQFPDSATGDLITAVEAGLADLGEQALAVQASGLTQTALDDDAAALDVDAITSSELADYPTL